MRHWKGILSSFCLLLLFIFSSKGFCQRVQTAPVKGLFPADSVDTGAPKGEVPLHPAHLHPSLIERLKNQFEDHRAEGPIRSSAADSQWVSFHLSATQWEWKIRRPGEYAAQSIVGSITGNVDILINFSGFEDLTSSNSPTQNVETYYGVSIGIQSVEEVDWVRASDFNARSLLINQNPTTPTTWTLWNKVCLRPGNSAFEYSDDAVITFVMQNSNPWIDPGIPTGQ
jgi:hypothetical protein